MSEVLIHAEGVGKKFCRSLKRSLWYGLQDMAREALPFSRPAPSLRPSQIPLRPDEFWAVNDVSFELRRGECLGLIGHNGAGKTTLLKMLNGLIKPDCGRIAMRGRVGAIIALGAGFNPILSGRENVYINGSVLGLTQSEIDARIDGIIDFADLREFIDAPIQTYSSGMSVRLGFAIASAVQPDILLLDEVLAVGDMAFQAKCFNRLGEMRRQGTAFILVSHNMHQITRFSDRGLHLSRGTVAMLGPTSAAVESFVAQMASHSQDTTRGQESAGSMGLEITEAQFTNRAGERIHETEWNEPVSLTMDYIRHRSDIECVVLDITLRLPDGDAFFQGTSSAQGKVFGPLKPRGRMVVTFPSIPANNQLLSAGIAAWSPGFKELYHWRRGIPLRVRGFPHSTGLGVILPEWRLAA